MPPFFTDGEVAHLFGSQLPEAPDRMANGQKFVQLKSKTSGKPKIQNHFTLKDKET